MSVFWGNRATVVVDDYSVAFVPRILSSGKVLTVLMYLHRSNYNIFDHDLRLPRTAGVSGLAIIRITVVKYCTVNFISPPWRFNRSVLFIHYTFGVQAYRYILL